MNSIFMIVLDIFYWAFFLVTISIIPGDVSIKFEGYSPMNVKVVSETLSAPVNPLNRLTGALVRLTGAC